MNAKAQAVLMSYIRGAAVAVTALYLNGQTNPKALAAAALAAVAGPALKALDPKATEFGIGSSKLPQK
jgi:hypothetical protein